MIALFPPGGNPKEMRLRGARILATDRLASASQSMARPLGPVTAKAGGATVMGSVIGATGFSLSRGRAMGRRGRAGRVRMKALMGITVGEDRIHRDLLRSTPITRA